VKKQVLSFIKRYKIHLGILLFFLVYMLFFDEFNWLRIRKDNQKLKSLKEERAYLRDKIKDDRLQLKTLQTDTQQLEKFAREEYLLKKENEDVFIIQEEE
jgi:cell division protein DivIC